MSILAALSALSMLSKITRFSIPFISKDRVLPGMAWSSDS